MINWLNNSVIRMLVDTSRQGGKHWKGEQLIELVYSFFSTVTVLSAHADHEDHDSKMEMKLNIKIMY